MISGIMIAEEIAYLVLTNNYLVTKANTALLIQKIINQFEPKFNDKNKQLIRPEPKNQFVLDLAGHSNSTKAKKCLHCFHKWKAHIW